MIMANLENNFYDAVGKTLLLMVDVCGRKYLYSFEIFQNPKHLGKPCHYKYISWKEHLGVTVSGKNKAK